MSILQAHRWKVFCPCCGHTSKFTGDKDEVYVHINKPCAFCGQTGVDAVELT